LRAFQDAKRAEIETYFEAFQHVSAPAERSELSGLISKCLMKRPRLDTDSPYFTEGYSAEVVVTSLHSQLLRQVSSDQIGRQRNLGEAFPASTDDEEDGRLLTMNGADIALVPAGELAGTFEFISSTGLIAPLSNVVRDVTCRIIHRRVGVSS
jgi:hypothetical protein